MTSRPNRISVSSPAKVTLYHEIVSPRKEGLWAIQSIVLPIALHDTITIQLEQMEGIRVTANSPSVRTDETNTCHRAAALALSHAPLFKGGISIFIDKKIPVSSGLGGGSSNAASVLLVLNALLGIGWDISNLSQKAISISRDSYFFCYRRPAYVEHFADNLVPLPDCGGSLRVAIIDPKIPFIPNKTEVVMARVVRASNSKRVLAPFLSNWISGDVARLQLGAHNFMTEDLVPEYKRAFDIKNAALRELGFNLTFSGTGPFMVMPIGSGHSKELERFCNKNGAEMFCSDVALL